MARSSRWLSSSYLRLAVGIGLLSLPVAGLRSQAIDQQDIIDTLRHADWSARQSTAARIGAIPATQRNAELIHAVVVEIDRIQKTPDLGFAEAPRGIDPDVTWNYYTDFVDIACESTDPEVIPVLIRAVDMGHPVTDALARFGDAAAPMFIEEVRHHTEGGYLGLVLPAFRMMLEQHPDLSVPTRKGIAAIVRQNLAGHQLSGAVSEAIKIAAVLNDPEVTRSIEAMARAGSASDVGLVLDDARISKVDPFIRLRDQAAKAVENR